ncbi:MAG: hypothetical protein IJ493_07515 [Clostridia bacterium]|nr:hypothetical protein [Clostridia bacterium]
MHKKISSALTLLLTASLLASCGDTQTPADTTTASSDTTAKPVKTEISDNLGEYDFKGRTFNIVYSAEQLGSGWPYDTEEANGDILNDAVYRRNTNPRELYRLTLAFHHGL